MVVARRNCRTEVEARGLVSRFPNDGQGCRAPATWQNLSVSRLDGVQTCGRRRDSSSPTLFGVACGKALPFDRDPEEYPPLHPLPQIIVLNFLSGMRREDNE